MKKNRKGANVDLDVGSLKNISRDRAEKEIKEDFQLIDADNSGYIDLEELQKGLKKYGIKLSVISTERLMRKYDDNPDNKIDIREFVQLKRDIDANSFRKTKQLLYRKSNGVNMERNKKRTRDKKMKRHKAKGHKTRAYKTREHKTRGNKK